MKRVAILLLALVALAECLSDVDKRSLSSTLAHYGKSVHDVGIKLAGHLHDGISVSACTAICEAGAVAILEAAAFASAVVCGPLCDYTLQHLQSAIGRK